MLFVQPTERHTGYVLLLSMCVLHLPACLPCNSCPLQSCIPLWLEATATLLRMQHRTQLGFACTTALVIPSVCRQ